jgi:branched-chain amino acid transport system substrate-binding protein
MGLKSTKAGILSRSIGRRALIKAGVAAAALPVASPFILSARGETPIKIGMIDPFTGSYAAIAKGELDGAKLAVEEVNAKGGVMGRPLDLLVEDSANDTGTGVQKARKLIDRDQVNFILGDVNSGIALAIAQVTSEKGVLHIVPGGHTDPITGTSCHWNVFRICNTTTMDANAIADTLVDKLGKKWFFLTPDYAYGHSLQEAFVKKLKQHGGTYDGALAPVGTTDFSAYLIKAKAFGPQVLIDIMGGGDQVNSLKQFAQFGLQKQMAVAGSLFELEGVLAVPDAARVGWWTMEWWWDQPDVPQVKAFVDTVFKRTGQVPSARTWFGYVAVHTLAEISNQEKSVEATKLARAMGDFKLPPEVALMPGQVRYRAGDHQLMSPVFAGEVHPPKGDAADPYSKYRIFTTGALVPGEKAAGTVEETGCKLQWPA